MDIIKKVGLVIIKTRKLLSGIKAGNFRTPSLGSGYDFDQLREYQQGDDIRFIDWKSSARLNNTLIRQYKDERSRTMHILVDASSSMMYGSSALRIHDVVMEIAIALIALGKNAGDMIGLHCFTDCLVQSIAPSSGNKHEERLIGAMIKYRDQIEHGKQRTSLKTVLENFGARYPKKALVVLVSDFVDTDYESVLATLARYHEVIAVRIKDANFYKIIASIGSIALQESESMKQYELDDNSYAVRVVSDWYKKQDDFLNKIQVPVCDCVTDGNHIEQLIMFLKHYFRESRNI